MTPSNIDYRCVEINKLEKYIVKSFNIYVGSKTCIRDDRGNGKEGAGDSDHNKVCV